jgi:hypothetical protein
VGTVFWADSGYTSIEVKQQEVAKESQSAPDKLSAKCSIGHGPYAGVFGEDLHH